MNKEQIYDERIAPLMAQILDICKAHKIAMVASFAIPIAEYSGLRCTSALLEDDHVRGVTGSSDYFAAKAMLLDGFVSYTTRVLKSDARIVVGVKPV